MDMACAWDSRVTERETEKTSKYQELAADLHHQWRFRVKVIPVVLGDLGTVTHLKQHLKSLGIFDKGAITTQEDGDRWVIKDG